MKKILLIGGTGAIGEALSECLSKDNEVFITSRSVHNNSKNITYIKGNGKEKQFLTEILKEKYDCIVDFMMYDNETFKNNIDMLLKATSHYIFLSSARVYAKSCNAIAEDFPRILEVCEDQQYISGSEYAIVKAQQEDILKSRKNNNYTIVRPYITFNDYRLQLGIYEKESWLFRALEHKTILLSKDIMNNLTTLSYGNNVALLIKRIIEKKEKTLGEIYNVIPFTGGGIPIK